MSARSMRYRYVFLIFFLWLPKVCFADNNVFSSQLSIELSKERHGLECAKEEGFALGPAVPTRNVAKQIYIAIAKGLYPRTWRKYPMIFVRDDGDKWGVGQRQSDKTTYFRGKTGTKMENVQVTGGGGALEMTIDKCNAGVSMSFSR